MKEILIITFLVALSSCTNEPTQTVEQQCAGYGFKPGTDGFANCLMEKDLAHQQWESDFTAEMARKQHERFLNNSRMRGY